MDLETTDIPNTVRRICNICEKPKHIERVEVRRGIYLYICKDCINKPDKRNG